MSGDDPDRPTVPEVLPLVRYYYALPGNGVGGSLHIALDDGNLRDGEVAWCHDFAVDKGDHEGAFLAAVLYRMSKTQRGKLSANAYAE